MHFCKEKKIDILICFYSSFSLFQRFTDHNLFKIKGTSEVSHYKFVNN